ncbi:MAG TPA: hypothetical protein VHE83_18580 [Mycobacteriales bacterium]|nr:hypothetical protein [Mycobacteriales bacterium]
MRVAVLSCSLTASVGLTAGLAAVAVPASAASTPIHVIGSVGGSWTQNARPGLPDTGGTYVLSGKGRTNYGATKASGQAHGTGFIQNARCTAALSLGGKTGRVTVDIMSTATVHGGNTCQGGYAFTWTVEKGTGTGTLAGRTGHGTGYLNVTASNTFTARFDKS